MASAHTCHRPRRDSKSLGRKNQLLLKTATFSNSVSSVSMMVLLLPLVSESGSAGGENSYWGNALVLRDPRQQRFPNRSRSCSCWRFPGQSCLYLFWLWPPVVQIVGCLGSTDVDCDSDVFFVSFKPLYLSFVQSGVLQFPYRKPQLGDQLGFTILRVNFPLALANRISDG